MLNLGTIFGVSKKAEALVTGYKAELTAATAGIDTTHPLRVFAYDSGETAPFTAGK